jgi:hypothetical protein
MNLNEGFHIPHLRVSCAFLASDYVRICALLPSDVFEFHYPLIGWSSCVPWIAFLLTGLWSWHRVREQKSNALSIAPD